MNFVYTLTVGEKLIPDKLFLESYNWIPLKVKITGSDKGFAPTGENDNARSLLC